MSLITYKVVATLTLGQRLKTLRQGKGLTQAHLGSRFGLAESTISLYEADKRAPDYNTLKELAAFFQVSLDYLLGHTAVRPTATLILEDTPLYGSVPALPEAVPELPLISEKDLLFRSSGETGIFPEIPVVFWFEVEGTSLNNEGILPHDLVLIQRTPRLKEDELGLAFIESEPDLPRRICWVKGANVLSFAAQEGQEHDYDSSSPSRLTVIGRAAELRRTYMQS